MSLTMDLYVLLGALLAVADDGSHLVVQNFCTTSRKGHQTGLSEALEDIDRADGRPLGEVLDLNGGQRFDGHVRVFVRHAAEERLVMFNPPLRVESAHRVNLVNCVGVLGKVCHVLIDGHGVRIIGLGAATECTKATGKNANVRLVDVDVRVEERLATKARFAHGVGQRTEFMQVGVVEQHHTVLKVQGRVQCKLADDALQ